MPDWRTNCAPMSEPPAHVTDDAFLGGRLLLRQPKSGHRAGHDALLLAAATPARPGQRVVDFGAGVGAAGLAVAKRVGAIQLVMVEIDENLAELAHHNAASNGIDAGVVAWDVASDASTFAAAGLTPDSVDVVLMNPPFNDPVRHRGSPDTTRELAHRATADTLENWTHAARRILKSGGVLSLIWRADGLAEVLQALDRGFGSVKILPVHADSSKPAMRVLVCAIKGGKAPLMLHGGLVLKDESGLPNKYVEDILAGKLGLGNGNG